jgi:RHH-type transcriptional regulator, rel operon repressor / antitoxin RelB
MSDTTLISVRVPKETAEKLAALAEATDRSKSYLAAQAIEEYLETQEWQIRAIEEGIKDVEEGRVVSHERVKEWLQSWGTEGEKEMPECN